MKGLITEIQSMALDAIAEPTQAFDRLLEIVRLCQIAIDSIEVEPSHTVEVRRRKDRRA